jgi:hypothetical protein
MSNVYRYRRGPQVERWVAKTGTVAIEQGDMLKITGSVGAVTPVKASGDSLFLAGIAMDASPATDATGTKIRMLEPGHGTVFEFPAAAKDQYYFGGTFKITGDQELTFATTTNTTMWTTATNIVAICAETTNGSSTNVLVQFLAGVYQKDIRT